jgi:predicted oxidoreductase
MSSAYLSAVKLGEFMSELTLSPAPRALGNTSIMVSPLAWGMWRFAGSDLMASRAKIDAAFESGITFFDTADIYGADTPDGFGSAEALLGKVFSTDKALRGRMVLASKVGIWIGIPYNSSKKYLMEACEACLIRLQTDYLDLFQIHRPDILAHPHEVADALTTLRVAGKIREVGVSNHTAAQTAALQAHLDFPIATQQPEFSALQLAPLNDGVMDQAMERNIAVMAWSPLGQGRLGDGPKDARAQAVYDALKNIADRHNVSVGAAAYAWIMAHPVKPIPIVGSQNPDRIREARDAYKVTFTKSDWYTVLVASRGEPLP